MKIYRASYRDQFSEHKGYEYFSSKAKAVKEQNKNNRGRKNPDELTQEGGGAQTFDEVETIEFEPSKKGILQMLNIHCSYPDNG